MDTATENNVPESREGWGSRIGFVLAAIGSAVGLGNMWRFPYAASESGGAAFVFLYIFMVFLVGIPLMASEFVVGRRTRLSPVGALRKVAGRRWSIVGYLFVLVGFSILAYYAVIMGWTLRYTLEALFVGFASDPAAHFNAVATGHQAAMYHLVSMVIMAVVVAGGIKGGIERVSMVLMPVLFLLVLGLAIWASTLANAGKGYAFYLDADLREFFSLKTMGAAAGQAFFSLSIGMGAMLTYASYLSRNENLPMSAVSISMADFLVAFVAGLVVFPLIFAFGLTDQIGESTVGTLFIGLPTAFTAMGAAGRVVGFMFFAALLVGALTSGISLLEVVTATVIDGRHISRKKAALAMGACIAAVGLPCAYNLAILELLDQIVGNILLAAGSLALAVLVGWRMDDPIDEIAAGFGGPRILLAGWQWTLRLAVPVLLVFVLIQSLQDTWAMILRTL